MGITYFVWYLRYFVSKRQKWRIKMMSFNPSFISFFQLNNILKNFTVLNLKNISIVSIIYECIQFNCLITCLYRRKQGTFLVIRYCFSFGKYDLILHSSPQAHSQVGHVCTKWSPAVTNSFGVTTPVSLNFDSYKTKIILFFILS